MIKKFVSVIMIVAMFITGASVIASAEEAVGQEAIIAKDEIVFIFDDNTPDSIKDRIISDFTESSDSVAQTRGLTCTLFGHKLDTGSVTTVTHKAKATSPRCLKEYFNYEICTRCEYSQYIRTSYKYIECCK